MSFYYLIYYDERIYGTTRNYQKVIQQGDGKKDGKSKLWFCNKKLWRLTKRRYWLYYITTILTFYILQATMNNKQKKLLQYLKTNIDFSGYTKDGAIYLDTINNLLQIYQDEVWSYETIRYRLWGLPSCLSLAFSYHDISKVLLDCWYKESINSYYQNQYYWGNLAKFIAMWEKADKILSSMA